MDKFYRPLGVIVAVLWLAACGSSSQTAPISTDTTPGSLVQTPPLRIGATDAASLTAQLQGAGASGAALLQLAGAPVCGVDFYYMKYNTTGGAGEATISSGALLVPTGAAPACSGPRPIVLYAHGTTADKTYNIATIPSTATAGSEEALVLTTFFASHGYIVVAPNFAGYDISTLPYYPFANAQQESGEMIDALTAARAALPATFASSTTDSGKLFITGYSIGGHVAMAATRALQLAGKTVTASAPASGPYALEAFGDAIFYGQVPLGATEFAPLLTTSYQNAYKNIYNTPADVYSSTYATGIDTLLPSATPLDQIYASGILPATITFDSMTPVTGNAQLDAALAVPANPVFAAGFGEPPLVINSYRLSYVLDAVADPDGALPLAKAGVPLAASPQQPLRNAFWKNDFRNGGWVPESPLLMCGGSGDPTVFFGPNTGTMEAFWGKLPLPPGLISVLDLAATPAGPFALLQGGFQQNQAGQLAFLQTPAGGGLTPQAAQLKLIEGYHGALAVFCVAAAAGFFAAF